MKHFTGIKDTGTLSVISIALILLLMTSGFSFAQSVIYVRASAGPNGDGNSWATAYNNLQTALGQAYPDDQIWVAKGTYYPGGIGRESTFQIPYGVSLYGGFSGSETDTSQRVNYGHGEANETILSGDGGVKGDSTDNYYNVVTFETGVDYSTVFSGFTITKGNADGYNQSGYNLLSANDGGGILNEGSPIIENCTIIGNNADLGGGGIENFAGGTIDHLTPLYYDCIISGNTAGGGISFGSGGGIENYAAPDSYCEPKFINCIISGNYADEAGGVHNIWDNTSTSGDCNPEFINCTITGNDAPTGYTNEMLNENSNCKPVIINCIICDNNYVNPVVYPVIGNGNSAAPIISYSLIEESGGSGQYWDPNFGTDNGNNIDQDPLFKSDIAPATAPTIAGDFHLLNYSPALSAGTPAAEIGTNDIPIDDIEGNLRPEPANDPNIDMGAYEEDSIVYPLPVELTTFTASVSNDEVELKWKTTTEINNYGFEVERLAVGNQQSANESADSRNLNAKSWMKIGFVKGNGNSNSTKKYSFVDSKPEKGKVEYRLKQIDNDGTFKYSKTIDVNLSAPTKFTLYQNFPNPFNPTTTIEYEIPKAAHVTLKVYDLLGNVVETLVNKEQQAGKYSIEYGARSMDLASGVYFYRLKAFSYIQIKKMLLLK